MLSTGGSGARPLQVESESGTAAAVSRTWLAELLPDGEPLVWLPAPRGKLAAVPVGDWRLSFRGMAIYPAYRVPARIVGGLLRVLATGRAMVAVPRQRHLRTWPLRTLLQTILPQPVSASAVFAPGDPKRRATLLIMDKSGAHLAFVKYAQSPDGVRLLRNEADILSRAPAGVGPTVLLQAPFRSGEILVESVVHGRTCAPRLALGTAQQRLLQILVGRRSASRWLAGEHPLVAGHSRLEGLHRPVLERALGALQGRTWGTVLMHGDFSFANTREVAGVCAAFDWEWGTEAGFPHLDAAHWLTRVACNIQRRSPRAAAECVIPALKNAIDGPDREYAAGLAALEAIHCAVSWYGPDLTGSMEAAWLLRFADECLAANAAG